MNTSIHWTLLAYAVFTVLLPTALGRNAPVQSIQSQYDINKPYLLSVNVEKSKASTPVRKDAIFKDSVPAKPHVKEEGHIQRQQMRQIAGSSLPDCSHACGACSPCRRVAVSFKCSMTEGSESCPMAYRCMCRGKTFPIP